MAAYEPSGMIPKTSSGSKRWSLCKPIEWHGYCHDIPVVISIRNLDNNGRTVMAWELLFTSDIGLLSLATILFMIVMVIYIGRYAVRHMNEEMKRQPSNPPKLN
jgi:hypothetical protein